MKVASVLHCQNNRFELFSPHTVSVSMYVAWYFLQANFFIYLDESVDKNITVTGSRGEFECGEFDCKFQSSNSEKENQNTSVLQENSP